MSTPTQTSIFYKNVYYNLDSAFKIYYLQKTHKKGEYATIPQKRFKVYFNPPPGAGIMYDMLVLVEGEMDYKIVYNYLKSKGWNEQFCDE